MDLLEMLSAVMRWGIAGFLAVNLLVGCGFFMVGVGMSVLALFGWKFE